MVLWALLLFESNCKIFLPESVVTVCFRGEEGGLNRFLLCECTLGEREKEEG